PVSSKMADSASGRHACILHLPDEPILPGRTSYELLSGKSAEPDLSGPGTDHVKFTLLTPNCRQHAHSSRCLASVPHYVLRLLLRASSYTDSEKSGISDVLTKKA